METPAPGAPSLEDRGSLLLITAISLAFAWILWPLSGAVLWGTVIAILFAPLYRRLSRAMGQRRNLAALTTLTIIVVMVILPLTLVTVSLVREAAGVYARIQSGELNIVRYFQQVYDALPAWAVGLLDRCELTNLGAVKEQLSTGLLKGSQVLAAQAINLGQNTFDFLVSLGVMVYLLFEKFTIVIRATVKGNIVVALLQGALGGLIFWLLGIHAALLSAVVMAVLSLLPAVGAALVWLPVAVYLLATGAVWQGVVLIAYGVLVIGLVDNVVRPVLVGQDTKMPDYVVLISTLGGIAIFGVNGFLIGPVIAAMFMAARDIFSASRLGLPIDRAGV
jgi:predicted PurR-regulated permease PerM